MRSIVNAKPISDENGQPKLCPLKDIPTLEIGDVVLIVGVSGERYGVVTTIRYYSGYEALMLNEKRGFKYTVSTSCIDDLDNIKYYSPNTSEYFHFWNDDIDFDEGPLVVNEEGKKVAVVAEKTAEAIVSVTI